MKRFLACNVHLPRTFIFVYGLFQCQAESPDYERDQKQAQKQAWPDACQQLYLSIAFVQSPGLTLSLLGP